MWSIGTSTVSLRQYDRSCSASQKDAKHTVLIMKGLSSVRMLEPLGPSDDVLRPGNREEITQVNAFLEGDIKNKIEGHSI